MQLKNVALNISLIFAGYNGDKKSWIGSN